MVSTVTVLPKLLVTWCFAINLLCLRLVDMNITGEINILKHPSSLLIPAGEIANFSCKARCINYTCLGNWIINSHSTKNQGHRSTFERKGFTFTRIHRTNNDSEHTLTMFVNASNITNNSRIVCEFVPSPDVEGRAVSNPATLLVISDLPISANPKLVHNATHLILLWSPPFIWPGQRIAYYNISVTERNERSISHYRVNGSVDYSNLILSFANELYRTETVMCTELYFCISPFTISNYTLVEVCISSDSSLPLSLLRIEFSSSAVNTTVLFTSNQTPVLYVQIMLPCSHQKLNYTITVENKEGHFITQLGPTPNLGTCTVRELITSNLEINEVYSLGVSMDSHSRTAKSKKYFFNTITGSLFNGSSTNTDCGGSVTKTDVFTYQIIMGLCLFILVIMILVLITVLGLVYSRKKREESFVHSKERARRAMVDNPIYAGDVPGPVYESILVHPSKQLTSKLSDIAVADHYEVLQTPVNDSQTKETARYIDHSTIPQQDSEPSRASAPRCFDTTKPALLRSNSTSFSTKRMGIKSNGQPRNKLNLRLSLGTFNDLSSFVHTDDTRTTTNLTDSLSKKQKDGLNIKMDYSVNNEEQQ